MKKWLLLVMIVLCLSVGGCVEGDTDGQVRLDPNVADQIEGVAEGAVGILTALSPIFPYLIPFAVGGAGVLGTYKRLKPQLTKAEDDKTNLAWGGELLATMLDDIKENHPTVWVKIGPMIHNATKSSLALENAIREFRHLAPKE